MAACREPHKRQLLGESGSATRSCAIMRLTQAASVGPALGAPARLLTIQALVGLDGYGAL